MPVVSSACAPFTDGHWLFSHNGRVTGWPASMAGLAAALPVTDLLTLDAPTDAALLWALLRHRLHAGEPPAEALTALVAEVAAAAPGSRLNLLLSDGETIFATAWGHALCVRADAGCGDGRLRARRRRTRLEPGARGRRADRPTRPCRDPTDQRRPNGSR